jgi:integrase
MRFEEFTLQNGRRGWKVTLEAPKDPATGKRRRIIERVYAPFKGGARGVERYAQRRQAEIDAQGAGFVKPAKDTLAAYLTHWLEAASRDLRPTTAASYGQMVRCHIIPALGAVPLADLAPFHVQGFLGERCKSGAKNRHFQILVP